MGDLSPERQADKRIAAQLVRAAGGVEAAAGFCRLGKSQLSDVGNVNISDKFMPLDVIDDLEAVTAGTPGWPQVTRALARRRGFELVPMPEASDVEIDWLQHIAQLSKEAGDVVSKLAANAAGGITAAEIKRAEIVREFDELVRIAVEGRAAALAELARG